MFFYPLKWIEEKAKGFRFLEPHNPQPKPLKGDILTVSPF